MTRRRTRGPLGVRFMHYVHQRDGCWMWTGARTPDGYGNFWLRADESPTGKRKCLKAHRIAYFLGSGVWPPADKMVLHSCDLPRCVFPDHLFLGDQTANMRDKTAKGRHHQSQKTHCKQGHAFVESNTRVVVHQGVTRRVCKECARAATRRSYRRSLEGKQ